ncbi:MAG: FAD-binding oxidoreductase [Gammaproteobacteria bacterium]|nr:FAD-binding oxidoreductase [Gammaproteobacteria bacterium]
MSQLVADLVDIVGSDSVLTGEDVSSRAVGIWRPQGIQAHAIVRPRTTEEVSAILRLCYERGQTVIAHGGRTGLVEGADTGRSDLILSLERMNQIESVDDVNRTMTLQAGVLLQAAQEAAERHGLLYPLDIGARGSCTIGGNIATNAGGNRVIRYGMTRDMVLGTEAVLADGTIVSSMNEMIKNNAGYDIKQLFIGTEGCLGIVTRAVVRLRELPRSQEAAIVAADCFEKMPLILKHMDARLGGTLSAFEVMWNDFYRLVTTPPAKQRPPLEQRYPIYVLIEAMGGDPDNDKIRLEDALAEALEKGLATDATVAQNGDQRGQFWAMRDDVEQIFQYDPVFIYDVSLQVPYMERYVEEVRDNLLNRFGDHQLFTFGHMGDGNLHFAISAGEDESAHHDVNLCVYEPLRPIGGSVSAEHGVGLEKRPYLDVSRNDTEVNLMRTLKTALDPKGILNPGKVFAA